MKTIVSYLVILFATGMGIQAQSGLKAEAEKAFAQKNLSACLALYRQIAADPDQNSNDRVVALEKIGNLYAQFYQDFDSAIFYARQNLVNTHQCCLASGYCLASGKYQDAIGLSRQALRLSHANSDSMEACSAFAGAVLKYAEAQLRQQQATDPALLTEAWDQLTFCFRNEPESPYLNEKRLAIALLRKKGDDALQCWKDYFLIQGDQFPAQNLSAAYLGLQSVLAGWNGEPLGNEENTKIILALSKSRFYPLIESLSAEFPTANNREADEIMAFCRYRKAMEDHIYSFYRDIAFHRESLSKFEAGIKAINLNVWQVLCPGRDCNNSVEVFRKTLLDRFGTLLYFHTKGSIHVYFGGSAVVREVRPFETYGYKTDFDFALVDFVFGNVFDYWYNNQGFLIGGWNEGGINSHFRRNTTYGPIWVWNERIKTQEARDKWKNQVDRETMHNDSVAAISPLADLPGLRDRLEYRFNMKVLDSLQALNLSQTALRTAFIRTLWEYENDHNYWHEGRHNLDTQLRVKGYRNMDSTEYWAKLSQIAFARMPSLELKMVMNYHPTTGPDNGHTAADAKLVRQFYEWMQAHRNEIQGLDEHRPLLCQVDLLTEEQIRNIARSYDPLYRKYAARKN